MTHPLWFILISTILFQITVSIDGSVTATGTTSGEFTKLSSNILYVAGSPHTASLPGSQVKVNFRGCLREVRTGL